MNRLLTSVICGLVTITTVTQANAARPRLVVGIVVDQLRTDYIEHLRDVFGEHGFKRLMGESVMLEDVDFNVDGLDAASATAMLYTGNYPSATGVPSAKVYDPASRTQRLALADQGVMGNFTSDTYSPAGLRLSTISDELMIDGLGLGQCYSVATDPSQALIMAGHAGTSAFWLDCNTGKWATTTYYKEVPRLMTRRNYDNPLAARIDTMTWRPARQLSDYTALPAHKRKIPFSHSFPRKDRNVYRMYASSPLVNDEVTDIAIDYLRQLQLGRRGDVMDMLNIGYTAAPWEYVSDGDSRLEMEDTYIRLDAQLERLFDSIDRYVGLDHTVVFLSSTGYYNDRGAVDPSYRIPTGEISLKRAISLLNAYFSAQYGNDDYVEGYSNGYVYLNHKTLEDHKVDLQPALARARDFLSRMSGVERAYTVSDILSQSSDALTRMRLSTDPTLSGDIKLVFAPGWTVVDDTRFPVEKTPVRLCDVRSPAFILAPGAEPKKIGVPVDATAIAPTLADVLRIRAPNGAGTRPLGL